MASPNRRAGLIFLAIVLIVFLVFVGVRAFLFSPPYIEAVFPRMVQAGEVVVISGSGFSPDSSSLQVLLGKHRLTVMESGRYHIVAVLPDEAESGMLRVLVSGRSSNAVGLEVIKSSTASSGSGIPHVFYEPDKAPQAPEFSLPDRSGKVHTLAEFKGRLVVLNFWASWCKPCVEELPSLKRLAERFKSKPFAVVAISVDKSWNDVDSILKGDDGSLVVLLDTAEKTPKAYGTNKYPETYIIDGNGKVLGKFVGSRNWTSDLFVRFFERLLENQGALPKPNPSSDTTKNPAK